MALNDKSTTSQVYKVSRPAFVILLGLLALAISEFVIMNRSLSNVRENFNLIKLAHERSAEVQQTAYVIRSLVLLNKDLLTEYNKWETKDDLFSYLKSEIAISLDRIYALHNAINLSPLKVSDPHKTLLEEQTVSLYFL